MDNIWREQRICLVWRRCLTEALVAPDVRRDALEGRLLAMIRRASNSPLSRGTVGPQCSICLIRAAPDSEMENTYYSAETSWTTFGANSVFALSGDGAFVVSGASHNVGCLLPAPNVPTVGRNRPCPCRSGLKYKHCHRSLRYGYLPMTSEIVFNPPHAGFPSGRRFVLRNRGTSSVLEH